MRRFQGSIVALITPFRNGRVDEPKLRELVEFHVTQGTDGIVACGTTGEDPGLSHDEHEHVVETIIRTAAGRLPVIVGTGSNSTAHTVDLTRHAERAGGAVKQPRKGGQRQDDQTDREPEDGVLLAELAPAQKLDDHDE